jgi:allantoinase
MPTSVYLSRRVVLPEGTGPAAVLVDDDAGRILRIADYDAPPSADTVHPLDYLALLPGLIDPHVHINEPGRTEWEGFDTATRAAAAGGFTTLVDMPLNCLPETTTVAALEVKRRAADGQTHVDWCAWGGSVGSISVEGDSLNQSNHEHLLPLARAGVAGFKCFLLYPGCDGLQSIDEASLRLALPRIAQSGLPLLVHAELAGPCEAAAAELNIAGTDWHRYATYLASRPDEAEVAAVRLMIELCREFKARVHIVHVSSAQVLPLLREARAEGLPITAETCPHYLAFAAEEIADGATEFKCAPPIRSSANRTLLWQALFDGTLEIVASDHSPCPPAMKHMPRFGGDGSFRTAWGGISSLSLGLPVMWTAMGDFLRGDQTRAEDRLAWVARWMAEAPARLAGVSDRKGGIAAGMDADLVIFDTDCAWVVTEEDLHFRHPVSPYLGRTLQGCVDQTILRGSTIFRDGAFPLAGRGRELKGQR